MAWYEELFDALGTDFERVFAAEVASTRAQVDFALGALGLVPGARLLDLCCGVGRHSLEFAQRGFEVTGLDRAAPLLAEARRRAVAQGLKVRWIEADMRQIPPEPRQDGIVCFFNSWGYFPDDAENERVLQAAAAALKPGGAFLLDVPNRDWLLQHLTHRTVSLAVTEDCSFDRGRGMLQARWTVRFADGRRREWETTTRVYSYPEMTRLLAQAGLRLESAHGGFDGTPLGPASPRCLLVARRASG